LSGERPRNKLGRRRTALGRGVVAVDEARFLAPIALRGASSPEAASPEGSTGGPAPLGREGTLRVSTIKTLATHEIVQLVHPRVVTEKDEIGMAVGKAIDSSLSRMSHEARQHRKPSVVSVNRYAQEVLEDELKDADLTIDGPTRADLDAQILGVLHAFRRSDLLGLPRPRTRLILIDERVGVYAQPDYWDGSRRFFEMKSYRAIPPRPDVQLQLEMFQLAFPECTGELVCFERRERPVQVSRWKVPEVELSRRETLLKSALELTLLHGTDKVLEYVDSLAVRYSV
jgi:hypothetical protein